MNPQDFTQWFTGRQASVESRSDRAYELWLQLTNPRWSELVALLREAYEAGRAAESRGEVHGK
jgi:hypothetical protein